MNPYLHRNRIFFLSLYFAMYAMNIITYNSAPKNGPRPLLPRAVVRSSILRVLEGKNRIKDNREAGPCHNHIFLSTKEFLR